MQIITRLFACLLISVFSLPGKAQSVTHVCELQELTFIVDSTHSNPYTHIRTWVDLSGPGLNERGHGFCDAGDTVRIRVVATHPGTWSWKSGSSVQDAGLTGKTGTFTAVAWSEKEKIENPLRRGFLRA